MPSGLVALLDDIAGITKLAAASLDDVGAAAGRAGSKAAGVVIDDAAVTPRYMTGFTPDRELPMIWRITLGSLRNKLLILLPAAIGLSAFAPWAITPLLMLGGTFLSYEGAEKAIEALGHGHAGEEEAPESADPAMLEKSKVSGAIRTDLILSSEIMAIALSQVATETIATQAMVLAAVGVAITLGVYGAVALIVKMDDIGLHLARRPGAVSRAIGRALVRGMPVVMNALSVIGTAAMVWVGGGILVHGLATFGWTGIEHATHGVSEAIAGALPAGGAVLGWIVTAIGSAIVGLVTGGAIVLAMHLWRRIHL